MGLFEKRSYDDLIYLLSSFPWDALDNGIVVDIRYFVDNEISRAINSLN